MTLENELRNVLIDMCCKTCLITLNENDRDISTDLKDCDIRKGGGICRYSCGDVVDAALPKIMKAITNDGWMVEKK
jgi:hypothetical protein